MTLPNFLVIGAPKAATTSLYHYLGEHPDIYMSPIKETNYFWYEGQPTTRFSIKTRAEYERLFAEITSERAIGEASPQYLNSATAPDRIRRDLPGVRLIVSLRNPVDRAYSEYLGWLRSGRGTWPLRGALRPGMEFFEHSRYHPRLERYFQRFPRSHIKVILFEDLVEHPDTIVRELFAFLEVDPGFCPDTTVIHNPTRVPRSIRVNQVVLRALSVRHLLLPLLPAAIRGRQIGARLHRSTLVPAPPLPGEIRRDLLRQFRDDIRRTADLIGRDLSGWTEELPTP